MQRDFNDLLQAKWNEDKSICVGWDPDINKVPQKFRSGSSTAAMQNFLISVINDTKDKVCAYKPNLGFFMDYEEDGIGNARRLIEWMRLTASSVLVVWDSKTGDTENTNAHYANSAFNRLGVDAVTVSPYLGDSSLKPFWGRKDKGVFVLCRTSNEGSEEFQMLNVEISKSEADYLASRDITVRSLNGVYLIPQYIHVAYKVINKWNKNGNCGLVVGANCLEALRIVRKMSAKIPVLSPAIGEQGGDLESAAEAGMNKDGTGMIFSASRSVLYASETNPENTPLKQVEDYNQILKKRRGE